MLAGGVVQGLIRYISVFRRLAHVCLSYHIENCLG